MQPAPPIPARGPSNPPHPPGLPDAPGWPIHPAMIVTGLEIPGFRIVHLVGFRYDATEIGQGLSEVLAYGTAAWVETAPNG